MILARFTDSRVCQAETAINDAEELKGQTLHLTDACGRLSIRKCLHLKAQHSFTEDVAAALIHVMRESFRVKVRLDFGFSYCKRAVLG